MVNSVADFGSSVWLKSNHINMIDVQLNEAMRIVSGTIRATHVVWLQVLLCNIIPPELRRKKALSNLLFKSEHHENSILFDII